MKHKANFPVRQTLLRWAIVLALITVFLFAKLVVFELDYWGPNAKPQDTDFVNVWAAGDLVRDDKAAQAYDWPIHHKVEIKALGHDFPGYYGWHYPPIYFFVAALLAMLPYAYAWVMLNVIGLVLYLKTMRRIVGTKLGYLFAFAWPPLAWNAYLGQNGLLTATLLGGGAYYLDKKPKLAGVYFGLLTYKPQYGLIIPFIMLFERRWMALLSASLTAGALIAASAAVFGVDSWQAFFHWMPFTGKEVFLYGNADLAKMQSLIGILRMQGVNLSLSWALQGVWIGLVLLAAAIVRQRSQSAHIHSAALVLATLMASPYLYIYDLAALAVAVAFILARMLQNERMTPGDAITLLGMVLLTLLFPVTGTTMQLGFVAMLLAAMLIYTQWRNELTLHPPLQQR